MAVKLAVERHGIDAVPPASRRQGWFAMFAMYAGINICLPMMLVGGTFVPGLSFSQVLAVGFLANGIGFLFTCLAAYPGIDQGLPVSFMTRVSLGYPWGTWIPSLAVVMSLSGWFAVQAELAGLAADGVLNELGGVSSPLFMIALTGGANVFFAVMGFGWMRRLATFAVPALLVLSAWLFATLLQKAPFREILARPGDGTLSFLECVNILVSAQVAGSFTASDISRYAKEHRSVWMGVLGGVTPVAAFMISLGALSALATGEWNPVLGVRTLGLGVGALLLIVFATWTTNDKNLYSGGLALTNLFPSSPRWLNTLFLGAVGTFIACLRLTQYFTHWLIALGIVFAPLLGLLLTDYFVIRARYLSPEAVSSEARHFRYSSGWNGAAIAAIVVGVLAGRLVPPQAIQPVVSVAATGLVYWLGMRVLYPASSTPA